MTNGTFAEICNGPGNLIWAQFEEKKTPGNGQFQMALKKLEALNKLVDDSERESQLFGY